jgi:hypothetical protein
MAMSLCAFCGPFSWKRLLPQNHFACRGRGFESPHLHHLETPLPQGLAAFFIPGSRRAADRFDDQIDDQWIQSEAQGACPC